MLTAGIVLERGSSGSPRQTTHSIEQALVLNGYTIAHRSHHSLQASRGSRSASWARLAERPIEISTTAVHLAGSTRLFVVARPGRRSLAGGDANVTGMIADLLHGTQAVNAAIEPNAQESASDQGSALPALVVPPESATMLAAVLADPTVRMLVQGQLRVQLAVAADPSRPGTWIEAPQGEYLLDNAGVRGMRTLAAYIGGSTGSGLPTPHQIAVSTVALGLCAAEERLTSELLLDDATGSALNQIDQQLRIRRSLPMRIAFICCDCQFEKIVNPDYGRIARRNSRVKKAINIGAAAVLPSASALTLGARVAGNVSLERDYVCGRCQGLRADEVLATICPGCGQLRRDIVLATCPNSQCRFSFATLIGDPTPMLNSRWVSRSRRAGGQQHPSDSDQLTGREPVVGWVPDPSGLPLCRWFDGTAFTCWITDGQQIANDANDMAHNNFPEFSRY